MVDKKKVDSLLLIPQSPLAVEDFFIKTKDEKWSVFLFVCFLFFEKKEKLFATLVIFFIFLVKMELWKIRR